MEQNHNVAMAGRKRLSSKREQRRASTQPRHARRNLTEIKSFLLFPKIDSLLYNF